MPYHIRLMRKEDCAQVAEIDREAFPTMWPPPNYQNELKNILARYVVACDGAEPVEPGKPITESPNRTGLAGLLARLRKSLDRDETPPSNQYILGFVGFWILSDEAHVTSIAVRKSHFRRGIGEMLLISAIELAAKMKARIVTLEVRISNKEAQSLYLKYGFKRVGLRKGYYTDNKEDALLMSTDNINSELFQGCLKELKKAYRQKWGVSLQPAHWPPASAAGSVRQGTG
ncbi:MAG: ribosomal protein S18-alanine N-acetyltransferase [Chloroflexi bacterium]|nr:ribosomal protein S18-alanine N-acetyltransferase [Chloroflexota bacterium]